MGGHRSAVQVRLDEGEPAWAEDAEGLGQGRRRMGDVLPDRERDDPIEGLRVEEPGRGEVAENVMRAVVGERLPGRTLDDIQAPRIGAEVVAQVPHLVPGSTADLQYPAIGQIDLPVDVEQSRPRTFGSLRSRPARGDRHEWMGQVFGMKLLHEVDVELRTRRSARADARHGPARLVDRRRLWPAPADGPG